MKKISREEISQELTKLQYRVTKNRVLFEAFKNEYENRKSRIVRFLLKADMDDYYQKYIKYSHRYEIVKTISNNYRKFLTGISKRDFKNTDKLEDLLNRMRCCEILDELKFNYDEIVAEIRRIRVNYEKSHNVSNRK